MTKVKVGDLVRILPDTWAVHNQKAVTGEVAEVVVVYDDNSGIAVNTHVEEDVPLSHNEFILFEVKGAKDAAPEMVEHPAHYKQGRFETIELIEEITKGYKDGYAAYCVGNAIKYLARAPFKHEVPIEDLQKAKKYIEFALEGMSENE